MLLVLERGRGLLFPNHPRRLPGVDLPSFRHRLWIVDIYSPLARCVRFLRWYLLVSSCLCDQDGWFIQGLVVYCLYRHGDWIDLRIKVGVHPLVTCWVPRDLNHFRYTYTGIMRQKRAKTYKRVMALYTQTFGFRTPFQILGTFILSFVAQVQTG